MTLEAIVAQVDEQIAAYEEELERLRRARGALTGVAKPIAASAPVKHRRKPAERGSRQKQALAHINEHPGCTVNHLAEVMGTSHSNADQATRRLVQNGYVQATRRKGQAKTFRVVEPVRLGVQGMAPRPQEAERFEGDELAHRTEASDRELSGTPA